jgi:hypothetical protein
MKRRHLLSPALLIGLLTTASVHAATTVVGRTGAVRVAPLSVTLTRQDLRERLPTSSALSPLLSTLINAPQEPISHIPAEFRVAAVPATLSGVKPLGQEGSRSRPNSEATFVPASSAGSPALQSLESLLGELEGKLASGAWTEPFSTHDIALLGRPGQTLVDRNNKARQPIDLPTLVRIEDNAPSDPIVRVPVLSSRGELVEDTISVPRDMLRPVEYRPIRAAMRELTRTISEQTSFEPGETVRVRNKLTGMMERATFVRENSCGEHEVCNPAGQSLLMGPKFVHKDTGAGTPSTLRIAARKIVNWASFEPSHGTILEAFLDGGAWLSSHPEFLAASHEERWRILGRYTLLAMRPDMAAASAEGLYIGFYDLLQFGIGVCRHLSTLGTAVLREAGYDTRIMVRDERPAGHAWIEVRAPANSNSQPTAMDLTNNFIGDWRDVERFAHDNPSSPPARWYNHPERYELAPAQNEASLAPTPKLPH